MATPSEFVRGPDSDGDWSAMKHPVEKFRKFEFLGQKAYV
jgi:hypothetical protein